MTLKQFKEHFNTGCYTRIDSNNVLIEDLDIPQLHDFIKDFSTEGLIRTIYLYHTLVNDLFTTIDELSLLSDVEVNPQCDTQD